MSIKPTSNLIIYQSEDGQPRLEVRLDDETVWLSQKLMAELFQKDVRTINEHIQNIFEEGELEADSTIRNFRIVQREGKRDVTRSVDFYNLDMIISVGYRVRSHVATRFRQWATAHIKEYLVKGFVLDDERLKDPDQPFDYFDELLRRIQDIRTSEKRFYQKITDIYATSVDYDPTYPLSIDFFKTVQNKMHWAITGKTDLLEIEQGDPPKYMIGIASNCVHRRYVLKRCEMLRLQRERSGTGRFDGVNLLYSMNLCVGSHRKP